MLNPARRHISNSNRRKRRKMVGQRYHSVILADESSYLLCSNYTGPAPNNPRCGFRTALE